jgi:hypothetical protein
METDCVTESVVTEVREISLSDGTAGYDIVSEDGFTVSVRCGENPKPEAGQTIQKEKTYDGSPANRSIKINGIEYL